MTIFKIGRLGDQPFKITDLDVGRLHAQLIVNDDYSLVLEDCDSTTGTYINLHKIIRKRVTLNTEIRLGNNTVFKVHKLLPNALIDVIKLKNKEKIKQTFQTLEPIWDAYENERAKLDKKTNKSILLNRMPYLVTLLSGIISSFFSSTLLVKIIVPGSAFILTIIVAFIIDKHGEKKRKESADRSRELESLLKESYLCPNPECQKFLGNTSFDKLKHERRCVYCKCEWI